MSWLVTGGAGYIGAHVVRALRAANLDAVVIDDLSTGFREFLPSDVPFVHGSLLDDGALAEAFTRQPISGVIHIAGYKYAGESVRRPMHTYEQNVAASMRVWSAALEAGVQNIVFSSSAAVYGTPDTDL
ncbi:MAG: NAD-dependent epimerase/dehydratase family protein, partial [Agromyces sp.]